MNSDLVNVFPPNRRILLVDDNRAIHEDFRKILGEGSESTDLLTAAESLLLGVARPVASREGFALHSAYQGSEALDCVRQAVAEGKPYAMAFVDVRMPPGWDGIETTRKIWEIYPDLQVVICTAYSDRSWDEMIAQVGQSDRLLILKKPFDNVEVLQLANALVAKWQLLQEVRLHVSGLEERVLQRTEAIATAHAQLQAEIDGRNKMEIQLRHAQKMESIGQLAAGIAHEINTPIQYVGDNTRFVQEAFGDISRMMVSLDQLLSGVEAGGGGPELLGVIKSTVSAADMAYLNAEIPKAIQQSLEGVERVARIVRSMKDFSHPGTNEKVALDLNRSIESTLTVCHHEWKYVADVVMEFDPTLPLVNCLPGEFNQVILNLIINASHAIADVVGEGSKGKGRITVSTRRDGEWAEVQVRDTGTGIPESAQLKVFDPFFTTKGVGKGTGQGLSIAHSIIVDKHGGTIRFETVLGKGTTFMIRLPLVADEKRKAA